MTIDRMILFQDIKSFFYGPKISSGEQLKIGFSGHDLFFEKKKKMKKKWKGWRD